MAQQGCIKPIFHYILSKMPIADEYISSTIVVIARVKTVDIIFL